MIALFSVPISMEIGSFLIGTASVLSAIGGGYMYYVKQKDRISTPAGQAAIKGNILQNYVDDLARLTQTEVVFAAVTNGGGVPAWNEILYYKVIKSSNHEFIDLFGDTPQRLDPVLWDLYSYAFTDGEASCSAETLVIRKQKNWVILNKATTVNLFFVQTVKGIRVDVLFVYNKEGRVLSESEKTDIYKTIEKIKQLKKEKI